MRLSGIAIPKAFFYPIQFLFQNRNGEFWQLGKNIVADFPVNTSILNLNWFNFVGVSMKSEPVNSNPDPLHSAASSALFCGYKNASSWLTVFSRGTYEILAREAIYIGRRPHWRQSTLEKFLQSRSPGSYDAAVQMGVKNGRKSKTQPSEPQKALSTETRTFIETRLKQQKEKRVYSR